MKFGVALPDIFGITGDLLIEWMHRIDEGPFSSIAVVDEIVSTSYDGITLLAALASATRNVRLVSTVIAGPLRNTTILAKQAASIDALSGGRLSLGLGVGELAEDFDAVGVALAGRGKRFDQQIIEMRRIWSGAPMGPSGRPIGPTPVQSGGPELLLGGWAPRAMERIGRLADGYIGAIMAEEMITDEQIRFIEQSWKSNGRSGQPRFIQNIHFALGPDIEDQMDVYLERAYITSPDDIPQIKRITPRTGHELREIIKRVEATGADELIFHPVSPDIDQLARLEDIIG
jgi:alkanesulfonate monooxygenase SsuD/methylene tetrahydromethanopterin reductase-like flavin-dependent oxidoreductase (luciferase family)